MTFTIDPDSMIWIVHAERLEAPEYLLEYGEMLDWTQILACTTEAHVESTLKEVGEPVRVIGPTGPEWSCVVLEERRLELPEEDKRRIALRLFAFPGYVSDLLGGEYYGGDIAGDVDPELDLTEISALNQRAQYLDREFWRWCQAVRPSFLGPGDPEALIARRSAREPVMRAWERFLLPRVTRTGMTALAAELDLLSRKMAQ